MVPGVATFEGTERYASRIGARLPIGHFRRLAGGPRTSSIGVGTYLGREDSATDVQYQHAMTRALERGINVIDTAINYRFQRSERAIGAMLEGVFRRGLVARDEVVVATKGGFVAFDGAVPRDPGAYVIDTYVRPGIAAADEIVGGSHCMAPRYLSDQIDRSRKNLGLATLDIYYLHHPETQLEVGGDEFRRRLRRAFETLETAVADGRIARYGTATWNGYRVDAGTQGHLSLEEVVTVAREVGGADHHFKVIQAPYNLVMTEAYARATQRVGGDTVTLVEAARRLSVYVMASASVHQGQLTRNLPPVVADFVPGFETDAQRMIQFVRSTPGIGTALVGTKSVGHVEENALVTHVPPLAEGDFAKIFTQA